MQGAGNAVRACRPALALAALIAVLVTAFAAGRSVEAAAGGAGSAANKCGCYRDAEGQCRCVKKGKCACPGDCEPMGCEEKRQKQMEKEAAAEIKRAQEAERKASAQAAKAAKAQVDREKREKTRKAAGAK
jgi:hypothetical protein